LIEENAMSNPPTFGELLNQRLQVLERSASWLAERLSVSPSAVSRWLSDESRPRQPELVARLADVLGIYGTAERRTLFVAAGFAYVEAPPVADLARATQAGDVESPAPGANLPTTQPGQPMLVVDHPICFALSPQQTLHWLRELTRWDQAPDHARLSWAGMTLYLLNQLGRLVTADYLLVALTAAALWIATAWLLEPLLRWPSPDLAARQHACWLFALACLTLPPVVGLLTQPDGYARYAPQTVSQQLTLGFLKLTAAYVGFGGFAGISWGAAFLWHHLSDGALPATLCWTLAALPLLFSHIGARRIPLDRYRLYGALQPHPADLWFLPIFIGFGPLLALFLYFSYPQLSNPVVGYGALLGLILLIWSERRKTAQDRE
jgi:transcriptional regulator with XRE-family HTH domain